jgi:7,8-dihydroneopterin aldolase/epimerase/oxygenase
LAHKGSEDRITLSGVKLHPRVGATPEERSSPQECEADLTFWGDFQIAAASDSLDKSIDYCRVLDEMLRVVNAQEYVLVETLAYRLARSILRKFPANRVNIKLRKRPASLRSQIDFVEIEVEEP